MTDRIYVGDAPPLPETMAPKTYPVLYTPELQTRIIDQYVGGLSLLKISAQPGMPSYGTILRWVHDREDFKAEFERARKLRALHFEEKALALIDEVEQTGDRDRAAVYRLKYDILAHAASVNDSSRFGKKTTIEGSADKPVVFKIVSHIPDQVPQIEETKEKAKELVVESEVIDV